MMKSHHDPDITELTHGLSDAAEAAPTLLGTTLVEVRRRARRRGQFRAGAVSLAGVFVVAVAGTAAVQAMPSGDPGPSYAPAAPAISAAPAAPGRVATQAEVDAYLESRREWVDCMRANGFPRLPDPDKKGIVDSYIKGKDYLPKMNPKVTKAANACMKFSQDPTLEVLDALEPPLTAAQIAANQALSECMRANGVTDYPDAGADGLIAHRWMRRTSELWQTPPTTRAITFKQAQKTCQQDPRVLQGWPAPTTDTTAKPGN